MNERIGDKFEGFWRGGPLHFNSNWTRWPMSWACATGRTGGALVAEWIRWYREGRLKAFDEGGRKVYDTIAGRRRRLGLAA